MKEWTKIFVLLLLISNSLVPIWGQSVRLLNEIVTLSDGVKLSTDVYLPAQEGQFPVLLLRTPYNKIQMKGYGNFFASNG